MAASRMGWGNIFQVEINPFCCRVLKKNFPDAKRFTDIRDFDGSEFAGKIDIVSGGFPCQPFSVAGQRRGKKDDRALWGEMLRVVRSIRPTWVVGENVAGIVSLELDAVLSDLEGIGYTCQAFVVPACAVGALHRRDRVWIIAHANRPGRKEFDLPALAKRQEFDSRLSAFGAIEWQPDSSDILRAAYGLPGRVDGRAARIKSLGNAIVPQVAFHIYYSISCCG